MTAGRSRQAVDCLKRWAPTKKRSSRGCTYAGSMAPSSTTLRRPQPRRQLVPRHRPLVRRRCLPGEPVAMGTDRNILSLT